MKRWSGVARWPLLVAALAVAAPAAAHPGVNQRIAALSDRIAADPGNALLLLRRGELHVEDAHFHAARADFRRAEQLEPNAARVHYYRGLMWTEAGQAKRAVRSLGRFLAAEPDHAPARLLRARALTKLGRRTEALSDLTHGIDHATAPTIDPYLARATLLAELRRTDEALAAADVGLDTFPNAVVLVEFAVQTEANQGHTDAALRRIAGLPARVRGAPHWLKRTADLLHAADRDAEAVALYVCAHATATALPASRQRAPAIASLTTELRRQIRALAG